jgi:hypothetical protein
VQGNPSRAIPADIATPDDPSGAHRIEAPAHPLGRESSAQDIARRGDRQHACDNSTNLADLNRADMSRCLRDANASKDGQRSHRTPIATLADLGVTRDQSSRRQKPGSDAARGIRGGYRQAGTASPDQPCLVPRPRLCLNSKRNSRGYEINELHVKTQGCNASPARQLSSLFRIFRLFRTSAAFLEFQHACHTFFAAAPPAPVPHPTVT